MTVVQRVLLKITKQYKIRFPVFYFVRLCTYYVFLEVNFINCIGILL